MEGPGVRAGGEDAGIQPAEVGERLVDVGGRGELGVVEEAVDILQDKRVSVEEDRAGVVQLPEAKFREVVERCVEEGLLPLREGCAVLQSAPSMGFR